MELSPRNDQLLIGSTDGCVRILDLQLPQTRKDKDPDVSKFHLNDNERLTLLISELKGCQMYKKLVYQTEDGQSEETIEVVEKPAEAFPNLGPRRQEHFVKSTCDCVKWSVNGRYAIASITSKREKPKDALPEDPNEEICRIKIWDTQDESFCDDLARPSGFLIKRNSWVLAPHPKCEEILMTGSDGGQLIVWNIKTKQLL
jgi:WD40 repeat protein